MPPVWVKVLFFAKQQVNIGLSVPEVNLDEKCEEIPYWGVQQENGKSLY